MTDGRQYAMGLFDGEGCISCSWSKDNRFGLRVGMQMDDEAPIRFMESVWGGNIHRRSPRGNGKAAWCWQLSATAARPFLEYAAAHSLTKSKQAEIALLIAEDMSQYALRSRKGKRPTDRVLDLERRGELVRCLRSLNGARQRYTVT